MKATNKRVVGYVRVSTDKQADSGAGIAAQRKAIMDECKSRGWQLVMTIEDDGHSARSLDRPGIKAALKMLKERGADVLMAHKIDRLSRSVKDFADLVHDSGKEGWQIVTLDAKVDTTNPQGRMLIGVLSVFAQFERELISLRTKDGLAAKKAQGVKLGRKFSIDPSLRDRIRKLRRSGKSYYAIAGLLNQEQVPTARKGNRWYPATVKKALQAKTP
jgi:DNA invertase Pin-like site-specific DNA recombinase